MTEDVSERLGVHAACQRVGGEGVAQVVEADGGQTRALEDALHGGVGGRWVHRLVGGQGIGEDPIRDRGLPALAQQLRRARREQDHASPRVGLGVAADERAVLPLERPAHMEPALRRVKILPSERADLAAPQPRGQLRVEEVVPVRVALDGVHQRVELPVVEDLLLRAAALRELYAVRRVRGQEPCADGGVERLMEQTMCFAPWGAGLRFTRSRPRRCCISIHPPRGGRDALKDAVENRVLVISIHPPRGGRDTIIICQKTRYIRVY